MELVSAKIILSRFIHHFIERYNQWNVKGFAHVRKHWTQCACGIGEKLSARLSDDVIEGVSEGIDAHGSLILKLKDGKKKHILAADIFPAEKSRTKKV